jgi:hypothetical protein
MGVRQRAISTTATRLADYEPRRYRLVVDNPTGSGGNIVLGYNVAKNRNTAGTFPTLILQGQRFTSDTFYPYPAWAKSAGALTTALAGNNNDLTFLGVSSTLPTIVYANPGTANAALSVGVAGATITVNLATDAGSAITSTAAQVKAAIDASGPASALVSTALAAGNDGTGVVTAMAATPLAGSVNVNIRQELVADR